MSQESELIRLENYVGKLLESFRQEKAENSRLMRELQDRDVTIAELREQLATNDRERDEIGNRVSRILESIEDWELGLEVEALDKEASNEADEADDQDRQTSLFGVDTAEERREER